MGNVTIAHLTDFHYDPLYAEGSSSVCKDFVCCRNSSVVSYVHTLKIDFYFSSDNFFWWLIFDRTKNDRRVTAHQLENGVTTIVAIRLATLSRIFAQKLLPIIRFDNIRITFVSFSFRLNSILKQFRLNWLSFQFKSKSIVLSRMPKLFITPEILLSTLSG